MLRVALVLCSALAYVAADTCTADGKTYSAGELFDFKDNFCVGNICQENGQYTNVTCGSVRVHPPKWVTVESQDLEFPACCPHVVPPLDLVPDLLPRVPGTLDLCVKYENDVKVNLGNELAPIQVFNKPTVSWNADPSSYYLLVMTDPDAPSRADPSLGEFRHWLVANIPGNNVNAGQVLTEYVGSGAPLGTGLHRYTFLLFRQPARITVDETWVGKFTWTYRANFSTTAFAAKYGLCDPVALNVFQAQYDQSVDQVLALVEFA